MGAFIGLGKICCVLEVNESKSKDSKIALHFYLLKELFNVNVTLLAGNSEVEK